jgi:hypothetical protein
MTFTEAKETVRALGFTLTKRDGEYRVAISGDRDHCASYYTDDLEDAVETARHMAKDVRVSVDDTVMLRAALLMAVEISGIHTAGGAPGAYQPEEFFGVFGPDYDKLSRFFRSVLTHNVGA